MSLISAWLNENNKYITQMKHLLYYAGSIIEVNLRAMYPQPQRKHLNIQ